MAKEKDFEYSDDEFDEMEDENESEEKKNKKEKKTKEKVQLPIFLELVYSFALIFTILFALVVAGMSYLSGATWMDVFVRTAITILSTGLLLWIFSLTISNGAMKTVKVLQEEALEKRSESSNQNAEDEAFSNNSHNMDVGYSEDE